MKNVWQLFATFLLSMLLDSGNMDLGYENKGELKNEGGPFRAHKLR